jgi:hypothetical protein
MHQPWMVRRHRGDGDAVQGGTAMVVEVAAGAAILAAMLCVSWYGWVTLPSDARVPVHFGPTAYNNFVSKRTALIMHPAVAVVLFLVLVAVSQTHGGSALFLPVVMGVLLVTQAGAIRVARRRSGGSGPIG